SFRDGWPPAASRNPYQVASAASTAPRRSGRRARRITAPRLWVAVASSGGTDRKRGSGESDGCDVAEALTETSVRGGASGRSTSGARSGFGRLDARGSAQAGAGEPLVAGRREDEHLPVVVLEERVGVVRHAPGVQQHRGHVRDGVVVRVQ